MVSSPPIEHAGVDLASGPDCTVWWHWTRGTGYVNWRLVANMADVFDELPPRLPLLELELREGAWQL